MSTPPSSESVLRLYYSPDINMYFFKLSYAKRFSNIIEDVTEKFRYWVDPRPLQPIDLEFLNQVINLPTDIKRRLISIIKNCLTIVNVANDDILDKVIEFMCNGEVLGTLNYDLWYLNYYFIPGKLGSAILYKEGYYNKMITDEHVIKIYDVITKDNSINFYLAFTKDDRLCGVGIRRGKSITIVRKWYPEYVEDILSVLSRPRKTIYDLFRCNRDYIEHLVSKVHKVVKYFEIEKGKRGILGFSGGKDSLLALTLLINANSNVKPIHVFIKYADHEKTLDYVNYVSNKLGIEIYVITLQEDKLCNYLKYLGLPTRGHRWCTPLWKLSPMVKFVKERFNLDKIVSYTGNRRFETFKRSLRPATYIDSEARLLTHSVPYKFPKLLEYLYLWYVVKLKLHPDYLIGIERVSCIICPFKTCQELKIMENRFSNEFQFWYPYIDKVLKAMFVSEKCINFARDRHLWRYYMLYKETEQISKTFKLKIYKPIISLSKLNQFLNTLYKENYYFSLTFNIDGVNLEKTYLFIHNLTTLYNYNVLMNDKYLIIYDKDCSIKFMLEEDKIYLEGFYLNENALEKVLKIIKLFIMSLFCIECYHCLINCEYNAIKLPFEIITSKCIKCELCLDTCILARYLVDMLIYAKILNIHNAISRIELRREKFKEHILTKKNILSSEIEWLKS